MSVAHSTSGATILREHVTLEVERIDQLDLNVYGPLLQRAAGGLLSPPPGCALRLLGAAGANQYGL